MHKSEVVRARIEPDIKHNAEEILKGLGLSNSQAIGLFYKQIILNQGLPFDLKIPNETTQNAIIDLLLKRNINRYDSVEDLMKKFS